MSSIRRSAPGRIPAPPYKAKRVVREAFRDLAMTIVGTGSTEAGLIEEIRALRRDLVALSSTATASFQLLAKWEDRGLPLTRYD